MTLKLMGKKRGMTQRFDKSGNCIVCTVIEINPNVVTQIKTKESDGYGAVQIGFGQVGAGSSERQKKLLGKPVFGKFVKAGVEPKRHLIETRVEASDEFQVGLEIKIDHFEEIQFVDVCAVSKGKGYQGVMKLHNYSGIGRSHGAGPVHRHAGSTGMRSTPGRCLPGGKRASRMGADRVTVQNLKVVLIDAGRCLLLVEGSIPGANGALVVISKAKKKAQRAGKK